MIEFLSPPGMEPMVLAGLVATSFGTSFITAAFGIGGGVLLLALLASLLPPAALIPVHGVIQLGSNAFRAAVLIRHAVWPVVVAFGAGSVLGAGLGGAVAVELPGPVVQMGVGLFVLWSVFFKPPAFMRKAAAISGAVSSFLTMFFGATGPFVVGYIKSLNLERHAHVGTHALCMTIQHLLKSLVFGFLGFAFGPYLGFIGAMIAAGFLGTLAGKKVLTRIDDALFKKILSAVLLILAARLLWSGANEYLAAG